MVSAQRGFEGVQPLSGLPRLREALVAAGVETPVGECRYALRFDRDALGIAYLEIHAEAGLPLVCQRSLEPFELPVRIEQRLGLIKREEQEAALPEGYEPVLVAAEGIIDVRALLEDELILAIPVVPVKPGSTPIERVWPDSDGNADIEARQASLEQASTPQASNPFAALAALKKH
jgi:uncharacterized protein